MTVIAKFKSDDLYVSIPPSRPNDNKLIVKNSEAVNAIDKKIEASVALTIFVLKNTSERIRIATKKLNILIMVESKTI
jgi:hypothetical protein